MQARVFSECHRCLTVAAFVLFLPVAVFLLLIFSSPLQATAGVVAIPTHRTPSPVGTPRGLMTEVTAVGIYTDSGPISHTLYIPLIRLPRVLPPPLPPPIPVAGNPPLDFAAIRAALQENDQDLSFVKIGFHTGMDGNTTGLYDWMVELDAAGVPFFLKSADNAEPIYQAQQLMQNSGVPHVLVYRRSGDLYDVPNYNLSPQQAAQEHWQRHRSVFPPELDPSLIWLETINEVDKNRSQWLGEFSLATAQLAMAEGFRWAALGWSSGEPEVAHWQSPAMLQFLRLAAAHPDQLAVALHEYSYLVNSIDDGYPYKVGRFQSLFQVCDMYEIDRPTVLITEWGWTYQVVPDVNQAMLDIQWASYLYAAYPQVQGAAIWYLGGGYGEIHDMVQRLIAPMRDYSLSNYFIIDPGIGTIDPELFRR